MVQSQHQHSKLVTPINNGVVTNLTHHIDNPTTVVDDKVLNITDGRKKKLQQFVMYELRLELTSKW